jgi:hypothetical protein
LIDIFAIFAWCHAIIIISFRLRRHDAISCHYTTPTIIIMILIHYQPPDSLLLISQRHLATPADSCFQHYY